jgi:ABC-type amino acid transport substrate-binding protein
MKFPHLILTVILSAAVAFGVASYIDARHEGSSQTAAQESAYDRVMRTGVLRCGYADWPPYVFTKDPTTGKVSGIVADVAEAVAGKLKLKIEWAENTGWGSFIESLRSHRVDVMCAGLWRNAERGRYIGFTVPFFYSAVYPYVGIDDHRFDGDLSAIDQPGIRIATMDGEMSDVIAKEHFPKAAEISVPQLGQFTDVLMNVAGHKADIVFSESSVANDFMKANPGKIRRAQNAPFQFFPTSFAVEIHETELREMLDSALTELQNQGIIDGIISKYSTDPSVFLRIAKPYSAPTASDGKQ